jgi:hypothetical protein
MCPVISLCHYLLLLINAIHETTVWSAASPLSAIAAFQANNLRWSQVLGQEPHTHKLMPGITLTGSLPIFYKIPVTTHLAENIEAGTYPAEPTIIYAHLPALTCPTQHLYEGMKPLDNRATILHL